MCSGHFGRKLRIIESSKNVLCNYYSGREFSALYSMRFRHFRLIFDTAIKNIGRNPAA